MASITYKELQAQIAEAIIERAKSGQPIEWVRPWSNHGPAFESSYASGKPYRGVNQMWLAMTAMAHGYSSGYWITYNAAKKAGGNVRKGETSTPIFKVRVWTEINKETGKEEERRFFGVDRVFNLDQCDGVEAPGEDATGPVSDAERDAHAELVLSDYIASSGVTYREQGNSAYYRPSDDSITMPPLDQFATSSGFYGTAFHEAAHSTGHADRLARDLTGTFGTTPYALEEVVAEVASAVVCRSISMQTPAPALDHHAGYVQSWLRATSDDPGALTKAIAAGWKAADLVLGEHRPTYVNRYEAEKANA